MISFINPASTYTHLGLALVCDMWLLNKNSISIEIDTILSVQFCPYHSVRTILSNTILSAESPSTTETFPDLSDCVISVFLFSHGYYNSADYYTSEIRMGMVSLHMAGFQYFSKYTIQYNTNNIYNARKVTPKCEFETRKYLMSLSVSSIKN